MGDTIVKTVAWVATSVVVALAINDGYSAWVLWAFILPFLLCVAG